MQRFHQLFLILFTIVITLLSSWVINLIFLNKILPVAARVLNWNFGQGVVFSLFILYPFTFVLIALLIGALLYNAFLKRYLVKPVESPLPDLSTPLVSKASDNPSNVYIKIFIFAAVILLAFVGIYAFQVMSWPANSPNLQEEPIRKNAITPPVSNMDTVDWKTYKNSKFLYSFAYPESIMVIEDKDQTMVKAFPSNSSKSEYLFSVTAFQVTNVNNFPLEKLIETTLGYPTKTNFKPAKIDNLEGLKTNEVPGYENKDIFFVVKDNNMYAVLNNQTAANNLEYNFDEILSTFKFTNRTQEIDTSDWKVYVNDVYAFSFKYPSNWINDNLCLDDPTCTPQPPDQNYTERYIYPKNAKYPEGIVLRIIQKNQGSKTSITDLEERKNVYYTWNVADKKIEPITVDGTKAYRISGVVNNLHKDVIVLFESENYAFELQTYELLDSDKEYFEVLNIMLSTFKLTSATLTFTPTCMKRPACLDSTPRCLIPEPANGWCP